MGTRLFAADGTMKGYAKMPGVRVYNSNGEATTNDIGQQVDLIVGVEWNQGTDTWTRIDADGVEWGGLARASFDHFLPWAGMRRVNMAADGSINNVYGDAGYKEDGTNGRVMVQIPKFWVKSEETSANKYRWWIANYAASGFEVHPVFNQRTASAPADYIYVAAYEADGYDDSGTFKLHSRSGKQPVTGTTGEPYPDLPSDSLTIDQARTYAENIGSHWGIENIWTMAAIQMLYMIEYGNMDSQTGIGRGIVDKASGTGFAGELTAASSINSNLGDNGTGTGTGTDGLVPIAYRWIENHWGNAWKFIDGYEAVDAAYHILKATGGWTNSGPSVWGSGDYDASTATPITTDGYLSNIVYEAALKYLLIASAVAGSDSTYIPDYFYAHDAGEVNILLAGGNWSCASHAGLSCLYSGFVASGSSRDVGCRLEFIG